MFQTARIWQTAILANYEKAFTYLPNKSMIKKNQEEYYKAIQNCNNAGNSTEFIEFMLKIINDTIDELMNSKEIIEETNIADRTVRIILKKLLDNNTIEMVGNSEKDPNKKCRITE